jgi:VWFA-related protein
MEVSKRLFVGSWILTVYLLTLPLPVTVQAGSAQSQDVLHSDQTLRTNTRLVVVDVVATDNSGQVISDMKPDDLKLLEDGKRQQISSFTFHPPGKTDTIASISLPANVVTNAPSFHASSLNVMLFDTLNGDFGEQAYLKEQLLKYLSQAQLSHPIALFAMESHLVMLHDFSTDPAALKTSVERFKPPARFINGETATSRASAFTTFGDSHTSERDIATTLNELNALAKTLSGYPGRKTSSGSQKASRSTYSLTTISKPPLILLLAAPDSHARMWKGLARAITKIMLF